MGVMAETAVKGGVLAFVVTQFYDLTGVARHTGIGHIGGKFDIERCMGVGVAPEAAGQFIMRFVFMALAAAGNVLPVGGGVPVMAVLAADLGLVLAPRGSDISRWLAVAFYAVIV